MQILSKEFGDYDDAAFLKVVWNMSLQDVQTLLSNTAVDLKWFKNFQLKGKIMGSFSRRDLKIIKNRIKWINQIIASKKKNPDFIPDAYRS